VAAGTGAVTRERAGPEIGGKGPVRKGVGGARRWRRCRRRLWPRRGWGLGRWSAGVATGGAAGAQIGGSGGSACRAGVRGGRRRVCQGGSLVDQASERCLPDAVSVAVAVG